MGDAVTVGVGVGVAVAVGVGVGVGVGVPHGVLINCSLSSSPLKLGSSPPEAMMLLSLEVVPYKKPRLTFILGPLVQMFSHGS